MEELRILVEMVAELPRMAVWVLVGFFIYKVVIVGSVYGVVRLAINKVHEILKNYNKRKEIEHTRIETTEYRVIADKLVMREGRGQLLRILKGLRGGTCNYVHGSDLNWLEDAITEKKQRDAEGDK